MPRFSPWLLIGSWGFLLILWVRAANDTSPWNLFFTELQRQCLLRAMVFFSPCLWISPSSPLKNLWRCSSQIWYCQSGILWNSAKHQIGFTMKNTSPPQDLKHSCHSNFSSLARLFWIPNSHLTGQPNEGQKNTGKALKTKHRRLRENFRAAGSVCRQAMKDGISHPPMDAPILVKVLLLDQWLQYDYKLRTSCSWKSWSAPNLRNDGETYCQYYHLGTALGAANHGR